MVKFGMLKGCGGGGAGDRLAAPQPKSNDSVVQM